MRNQKAKKSAVELLAFKNGCLKAENGDASLYTLLSVISIIFLVLVWCMIWLSCSKANYFWDSCQGIVAKVTILGPRDAIWNAEEIL